MLPFLYRYQVQVYPDFEAENTYVTGTFDIKGSCKRTAYRSIGSPAAWQKGVPHLAEMADAQIKDKKGVTLWQITVFTQQ